MIVFCILFFSSTMKMKLANTHKSKIHFSSQIIYYYVVCIKKSFLFSTRMMEIQNNMSERAIELLGLAEDQPGFVLDIGCGSGLSGDCLDENGHYWIGIDISKSMLGK